MRASETVIALFERNNRRITVTTLTGKTHVVELNAKNEIMSYTGLNSQCLSLNIFDVVVDFLRENGGRALKGCGHNKEDKVGYGKCTLDTVCGQIAVKYYGHRIGESTFDPVFIVSAILDKADICENGRGYLSLKTK